MDNRDQSILLLNASNARRSNYISSLIKNIFESINPLETGGFESKFPAIIVDDIYTAIGSKGIFLQCFLVILKRTLHNY